MSDWSAHVQRLISKAQNYGVVTVNKYALVAGVCMSVLLGRLVLKKIISIIRKSPPQLYGLPFVGSLVTMIIWNENFNTKVLAKYGDIVSYNVGSTKFYKINNVQLASKVFDKALGRDPAFAKTMLKYNVEPALGMINDDRHWLIRRRMLIRMINSISQNGKLNDMVCYVIKECVMKELKAKLKENEKSDEYLWYPKQHIRNSVFNLVYYLTYGEILKMGNEKYIEYSQCSNDFVTKGVSAFMMDMVPSFIGKPLFGENAKIFENANTRFVQLIEQDNNLYGKSSNQYTILEIMKNDYSKNEKLNEKHLHADILTMILGGIDTTSHSIEAIILLLAKYPQMQQTVYQELLSVFGENGEFSLLKLNQLPLFRAYCHEALRIACPPSGAGVGRTCHKDLRCLKYKNSDIICDFADSQTWTDEASKHNEIEYDYIIDKDCTIELNFRYLLNDNKRIWNLENDTMTPNLNYWLKKDENGKLNFKLNKNSIPFSVGKRDCFGQTLAIQDIYAFVGHLLLNFKVLTSIDDSQNMKIPFDYSGISHCINPELPIKLKNRN